MTYLFLSGEDPTCLDACDVTGDNLLTLVDPVTLLEYLFLSGDAPGDPFPDCGPDPDLDFMLDCAMFDACP